MPQRPGTLKKSLPSGLLLWACFLEAFCYFSALNMLAQKFSLTFYLPYSFSDLRYLLSSLHKHPFLLPGLHFAMVMLELITG